MSNNASLSRRERGALQHEQARRLALEAIAALSHREMATLTLRHTEDGRPYCPEVPAALSISHSFAEVVVLSGPPESHIGVDVQFVDDRRPYADLAGRFLDARRSAWVGREDTPLRFCWVWSRMEAMMKATGEPLFSLLSGGEREGLPLSSYRYEQDEGTYVLSIYGALVNVPFARPLFA